MLMKVAGLPEQEASDWAYLAAEVINWEWLTQVLQAAGWTGSPLCGPARALSVRLGPAPGGRGVTLPLLQVPDHRLGL